MQPRTQSSLAVSGDGRSWALLNASPDLRQQIAATPELWPQGDAVRSSPIKAVVLTNGDVDHVAGLLSLREGLAFTLHASARVHAALAANSIFNVLDARAVERAVLPLDRPVELQGGLSIEAFVVAGKVALYLEGEANTEDGDTLGIKLTDARQRCFGLLYPGLRSGGCRTRSPTAGCCAGAVRRDALHGRRDDRARPVEQNRSPHGSYQHVRP